MSAILLKKLEALSRGDPDALPLTRQEQLEALENLRAALRSFRETPPNPPEDPAIEAFWEDHYVDCMQDQADREAAAARGEQYTPPRRVSN